MIRPDPAELAIHVSRSALIDISRSLHLATATATICVAALCAQNADADADIALALRWCVADVVSRQGARLRVIADANPQKGKLVASVAP